MSNIKKFNEFTEKTYTLYHGTDKLHEEYLMKNGFIPNTCSSGSQCGDPKYLYLTNLPESAGWYACKKGNDESILEIKDIPKSLLGVDPDDGIYNSIEEEFEKGNSFILKLPLSSDHFKIYKGKLSITGCDDDY